MRRCVPLLFACLLLASGPAHAAELEEAAVSIGAAVREGSKKIGVARLRLSARCILAAVAYDMNKELRDDIPMPEIRFESDIEVSEFDDAIEPQWGLRPGAVLNAYIMRTNTIYLMDDASYYLKMKRYIDDSLAHELAHFIQYRYSGDETLPEEQAVSVQTWFRKNYMQGTPPEGAPVCR